MGTVDPGSGQVRTLRLDGERIVNSFATDETGGVFIVSDHALYRFDADRPTAPRRSPGGSPTTGGRRRSPASSRRARAPRRPSSAATSWSSPTTPTRGCRWCPTGAPPRASGTARCAAQPVFDKGAGATENSVVAVGRSVIVENNYGYENPSTTTLGRSTTPGIARVGVGRQGLRDDVELDEIAPTSVPKVSLKTGLLYVYTKPEGVEADPWYFTAIDVRTGRPRGAAHRHRRCSGTTTTPRSTSARTGRPTSPPWPG